MHRRFVGLFRDTWWLMLIIVVMSIGMWVLVAPTLGILLIVCSIPMFLYFGLIRYNDEGEDKFS